MKVLLSIKPKYVQKIILGVKLYEYRKVIFKNTDVKSILVYSSHPEKRIVGEIEIEKILCNTPQMLWLDTYRDSGLTIEEFTKYFKGKNKAYAIKIKAFHLFPKPLTLEEFCPNIHAPQSFIYIKK